MTNLCAKLREARELAEDGSAIAAILDDLIQSACGPDEDEGEATPMSGGGPNKPPIN